LCRARWWRSALVLSLDVGAAFNGFARQAASVVFEHPFSAFVENGFEVVLGVAECTASGVPARLV